MATFRADDGAAAGTRTNTTITKPTGTAEGDTLILSLSIEDDVTPTPPTGFAQLINIDHSGQPADLWIWWKRAGGAEPASYTTTHSSSWAEGHLVAVQDASASVDPVAGTGNQGTGTTRTALSVTPIGDNAYIGFRGHSYQDHGASVAVPTGTTPTFSPEEWDNTNNLYAASGTLATAGATGNKSQTVASIDWTAVMIVVEDVLTTGGGADNPKGPLGNPLYGPLGGPV